MMSINKAQAGKKVAKKPVKKRTSHPNDDYKDMVDPATGKKGTMGGEGTTPPFGGPGPKKGTKVYNGVTGKYDTVKKNGGSVKKVVKKAKNGTSLGMKSVKAGFDKNPGVTRADIIVAGKKEAKKGATVKKAKSGTSMKKCRYGCK